jgi:GTP cyclohydrolase I
MNVDLRPTREEAEDAVRTLIRWAGDDPNRESLIETPARVVRSYEEFFRGYQPYDDGVISKTFENDAYHDVIILRDIDFVSYCEHHLLPVIGKVHIAYIPDGKVIGISKLARIVELFAKRLQLQERLTAQIANYLDHNLNPRAVAVMVEAAHHCMVIRGVNKLNATLRTTHYCGEFTDRTKRAGLF